MYTVMMRRCLIALGLYKACLEVRRHDYSCESKRCEIDLGSDSKR